MDGFPDRFTVIFGFIYHETLTFVDFHTTRVIVVYKIWPAFTFAASLLQLFVFFCECINHFPPAPHKAALQLCLCNHLLIQKQLCLHDHLTGTGAAANTSDSGMSFSGTSGPIPFQASRGWFDCLKKCDGLHNVKLTGKHSSADHEAAATFSIQFAQLIEEKVDAPEQFFNADETSLFWKKKCPRELSSQSERRQHRESMLQRTGYLFSSVPTPKWIAWSNWWCCSIPKPTLRSKRSTLCSYFGEPTERRG